MAKKVLEEATSEVDGILGLTAATVEVDGIVEEEL